MSTTTEVDPQIAARLRRRRLIITVLVASLIIHLVGGIGAGVWIVARYFMPPAATFEVKKEIRIAAEEREHRMNMAEFDAGQPKPSFTDKMSSARPTEFALPDLPVMPIDAAVTVDPSDIVTDQLAGLGGMGGGSGSGSGGGGSGGSAVNFFGISDMATRVVIVVDVSDTMFDRQPGKFNAVKAEAAKLIQGLGINTLFNIVIYEGGSVAMFPEPQPATDANKQKAAAWIQSVDGGGSKRSLSYRSTYSKMGTGLYEGGGTRTDTALKQALSMRPSTVFLITDGEMSRMGGSGGADKDDKEDKDKNRGGEITDEELLGIIKDAQAKMEVPARIHIVHFLTKAARSEEEKVLRAVARRNDGRFKQVKAEDY
ncbi:MAG: hypothetical protein ACKOJB_03020 [Chthoniobacterales bacterium]